MLLVAVPNPGVVAVMVADPAPTAVTGTTRTPEPAATARVAGTVATFVLLELSATVKAPDGGGERSRDRFCEVPAVIVRPWTGEK
jgi:hypothetical protein